MASPLRIVTLLCAGLFASLACSSEKDGPGVVDPYKTPEGFCEQWAKAACNDTVVTKCSGGSKEVEPCLQAQAAFCLGALPANYDSKNGKTCVEAVRKAYLDAKLTAAEIPLVVSFAAPCDQLSKGPGSAGDSCKQRSDCNTLAGLDCILKGGQVDGTCQVPVAVSGGDPCDDPAQVCPDTHYCDGSNCLTRIKEGQPCDLDKPCAQDLICATAGTCVPKVPNTGTCSANSECQSGVCAFGKGATTGTCVAELELTVTAAICDDLS